MQTIKRALLTSFLFILSCLTAFAGIETKEGQLAELEQILLEVDTHYGMAKFKEAQFGVTVESVRQKYGRLIREARTLEEDRNLRAPVARDVLPPDEFRQMMIAVAAEFRDGHFNILRNSSNRWTVGIKSAEIDGRLYVTGFENDYFVPGATSTELAVGDEIIAVDGRSVREIALENLPYVSLATYDSRLTRSLEFITNRSHRWVRPVQTGQGVRLTFKRGDKTFTGLYHWVNARDLSRLKTFNLGAARPAPATPYAFGENYTRTYFSEGLGKLGLPRGAMTDIGALVNLQIRQAKAKKAQLAQLAQDRARGVTAPAANADDPSLSTLPGEASSDAGALTPRERVLADMDPVTRLPAYTVRFEGKNAGVIRIPDYAPNGFLDMINEVKWLAEVLAIMENSTDGLIIDQVDNGGGYVVGGTQIARLFSTSDDMKGVTIDMRLNNTLLSALESWAQGKGLENFWSARPDVERPAAERYEDDLTFDGEKNFAQVWLGQQHVDRLRARYEAGERWSGATPYMSSTESYVPGEHGRLVGKEGRVYTKPILLLNDSRSASCGDFMPSLLQANGRAVVFGETSMGLGGPLYRNMQTSGGEMFMRCTMGFCTRPDGEAIENIGVVPDVPRWVGHDDLMNGFKNYSEDAMKAFVSLVGGADAARLRRELAERRPVAEPRKPAFHQIKGLFTTLEGLAEDSDRSPGQLQNDYATVFARIAAMDTSMLTAEDWSLLRLPLPRILKHGDPILASQLRKDAVVERLGQMRALERYTADAETLQLIDTISDGLMTLGEVRFNPCRSALLAEGQH